MISISSCSRLLSLGVIPSGDTVSVPQRTFSCASGRGDHHRAGTVKGKKRKKRIVMRGEEARSFSFYTFLFFFSFFPFFLFLLFTSLVPEKERKRNVDYFCIYLYLLFYFILYAKSSITSSRKVI
jgi:hypothetical protein